MSWIWSAGGAVDDCPFVVQEEVSEMAGSELPWRPPRVCDAYWSEFRHCKSLRHRFHQYYTYGTRPSCEQWKEDFDACKEWERTQSTHAKECLQNSERSRVSVQRNFTPVWEMRQSPPSDWHMPLNQERSQDS